MDRHELIFLGACILNTGGRDLCHAAQEAEQIWELVAPLVDFEKIQLNTDRSLMSAMEAARTQRVREVLVETGLNISRAAKILGMKRSTLSAMAKRIAAAA